MSWCCGATSRHRTASFQPTSVLPSPCWAESSTARPVPRSETPTRSRPGWALAVASVLVGVTATCWVGRRSDGTLAGTAGHSHQWLQPPEHWPETLTMMMTAASYLPANYNNYYYYYWSTTTKVLRLCSPQSTVDTATGAMAWDDKMKEDSCVIPAGKLQQQHYYNNYY